MDTNFSTTVCLPVQERGNNILTMWLIFGFALLVGFALLALLVFFLFPDFRIIRYKNQVKRIKRNMKFLKALISDYDQLVRKGYEVQIRARYFWSSDEQLGIHLQLSEDENKWMNSTREVVGEAKDCVTNYYYHRRGLLWRFTSPISRYKLMNETLNQIRGIESKMTAHFEEKAEKAKDIYKNMERLRLHHRKLLDNYTIEDQKFVPEGADESVAAQPSTSLDQLINDNNDLFSSMEERWSIYLLLPLHAFLKDLNQLQLETETEKLWKKQADKLIADAEVCIINYLWWFSFSRKFKETISIVTHLFREGMKRRVTHRFTEAMKRIVTHPLTEGMKRVGTPRFRKVMKHIVMNEFTEAMKRIVTYKFREGMKRIAMHQFREGMKRIVTDFDDLLETKDKHSFSFTDKVAEGSPSPRSITDDRVIASSIASIDETLKNLEEHFKQVAEMQVAQTNSLYQALEYTHGWLRRTEETAGRKACLEQLKSIAKEVDNFLEWDIIPQLKIPEIINAAHLLKKIVRICIIERKESTKVVGLKNEIRDLVSKLTAGSDNPSTHSIVGMKGVGKTTLAKAVYYNRNVIGKHFPVRVWVTVTEGAVNKSRVLLIEEGTKDHTLDVARACDHLKEKVCLVVLDNVSKTEDFDTLYETFAGSGWTNGSRIVLTTRFKNVASHADKNGAHCQIRLLTGEESWKLFLKLTNIEWKEISTEVEKLARKVVGKCWGLPLAILSLGRIMEARGITQENLQSMLKQMDRDPYYKAYWLRAWERNKQELDKDVSNCLYFCTYFPEDFEIPVRRLVNLWVAEDLVQQTAEDTAEKYLKKLRDRNMIQGVAVKSDGKIKTCRLPSILREIILQNSNRKAQQHSGTLFYHFDDDGVDANSTAVFSKKGVPHSIFSFDKRPVSKPGEHIGKILSTGIASKQFLEIRVLDLECVFRPQLPETLSNFNNIKYLGLRWTYLEEFPQCICKLMELETLDLKHTHIRVIPSSIWKLKKLKNLYLNQKYRSKLEGKPSGNFQENLRTLSGVFLNTSHPLLYHLDKLKNLQKLKLAFQLTESESELKEKRLLAKKIVLLKQLHSLRLRSINDVGKAKNLILENMSELDMLKSLQLFGKLDSINMSDLPQNLTDLTLSFSKLSDDPMPELQNLPKLKSLCFRAHSYTKPRMVCTRGSFRQLKVLRFWNLMQLKEWVVEEEAMPSLVEFDARSCKNLTCPTGLKHLKTLGMIKFQNMSEKFKTDISDLKRRFLDDVELYEDLWTSIKDSSP